MNRRLLRQALPFISLAVVLIATFIVQPRTMSYFGLNLMLQYAVPIALATIAQMFIITVNDLDLSIGPFVGLVSCIGATLLLDNPALGIGALAVLIAAYGAVGALVHLRNLPSIVVTLGLSFVWLGIDKGRAVGLGQHMQGDVMDAPVVKDVIGQGMKADVRRRDAAFFKRLARGTGLRCFAEFEMATRGRPATAATGRPADG